MELHLIGHASLFIRTSNLAILMDPVLWDPHQEGLFDIYPRREVLRDKLPHFNLLIISHRHLDHLDIRSLAFLPKNVPVLIPRDSLIEDCLRKLGYSQIRMLDDFTNITIGATTLLTTRSENRVPEYGIVIADQSGVIWNQVDTVVTPATVERVLSRFPVIDLLVASWQPMLEDKFQTNQGLTFPYQRYSEILHNIGLVSPRALLPGANAFCYNGRASWLNHVVFPLTKDRFLSDLESVLNCGRDNCFAGDPGDTVMVTSSGSHHKRGACEFVKGTRSDPSFLAFSPVEVDARIYDENPDGVGKDELESTAIRAVETDLASFLREKPIHFLDHHRWKVIYQLQVISPEDRLFWVIDFSGSTPTIVRGQSALANVTTYITASALYGLSTRTRGWDYAYLGGYYRSFRNTYSATQLGIVRPEKSSLLADPLEFVYPSEEILRCVLDLEIRKWGTQPAAAAAAA